MQKRFGIAVAALLASLVLVPFASSTIHPIVESFDCANEQAFVHHPLGDPADPAGQTPGVTPGGGQNVFAALSHANESAWFGHKLDGECGGAG